MSTEIENRMRVMEEKYEYQDHTVEMLNEVLIRQQNQIDKLEEELGKLREAIAAGSIDAGEIKSTIPPHY